MSNIPTTSPLYFTGQQTNNQQNTQGLNPYMTDNLYGGMQNVEGTRANSVNTSTLTPYANNQLLTIEEKLTGYIPYTDLVLDAANGVYNKTITIKYTDTQKYSPPQCFVFMASSFSDTDTQTLCPTVLFDPTYQTIPGDLSITGFVTANTRKDAVVLGVRTKNPAQSFIFTIYVIANSMLI